MPTDPEVQDRIHAALRELAPDVEVHGLAVTSGGYMIRLIAMSDGDYLPLTDPVDRHPWRAIGLCDGPDGPEEGAGHGATPGEAIEACVRELAAIEDGDSDEDYEDDEP